MMGKQNKHTRSTYKTKRINSKLIEGKTIKQETQKGHNEETINVYKTKRANKKHT